MSSTTPGSDGASAPSPGEATSQGQDTGGADRSAIRTSLAERFAAAKAEPPVTAPGAPSSSVEDTVARPQEPVPAAAAAAPAGTAGPRYGATATTSTARQPSGATRLGEDPASAAQARSAAAAQPPTTGRGSGARRVRLSVARIDPWSVMKLSFLMSIAIGIGIVVAAAAMWFLLDSMHVFADIRDLLVTLGSADFLQLMEYAEFDRVMSMAAIIAVVDILLLTALSTLAAFLYNIVAALVGGLHLTLTDD